MEITIGSLLGDRYRLVESVSKSRMSELFKAWDYQQNCLVVVKVATNNRQSPKLVKYLKREAKALKRFNDRRIVRFLDCGHVAESHFVVLEYIEGKDLGAYLKSDSALPFELSISIVMEVLEGLEVIHKEQLVHRDIKPGNLMITSSGVKIIDFGLVKSVSKANRNQKKSEDDKRMVGTPPYLSPEQACDSDDLDYRTDLYACGVVLHKLLTGSWPFRILPGDSAFSYWKHPLLSFSEAAPSVRIPDKLQAVVWKALAVDPNLRFQTAAEMRLALLIATKPVPFKEKFKQFFGQIWKKISG